MNVCLSLFFLSFQKCDIFGFYFSFVRCGMCGCVLHVHQLVSDGVRRNMLCTHVDVDGDRVLSRVKERPNLCTKT